MELIIHGRLQFGIIMQNMLIFFSIIGAVRNIQLSLAKSQIVCDHSLLKYLDEVYCVCCFGSFLSIMVHIVNGNHIR